MLALTHCDGHGRIRSQNEKVHASCSKCESSGYSPSVSRRLFLTGLDVGERCEGPLRPMCRIGTTCSEDHVCSECTQRQLQS